MKKYGALTQKDMSDSGQALVLLCLILSFWGYGRAWVIAAIVCLVLNMASPALFKPFAFLWLNLSNLLGKVAPPIIMSLQFFLLVLPIGLIRRAVGKDPMAKKKWRDGAASVFVDRSHTYQADDLRQPY